ncbi:hypothetical protein H8R23_14590 [Flavobacterium sp. F-380]|uniref:Helix-turn-helix domain-containing protein n=1 Tax=Flavobacterium kayseriense TaxID=2764714 RepID=A0ABR7JAT8_9FLAO|nr:hypothetical protein [Flavobacterium kayseriense]MBC5842639.1 hypothetical protein [Flavobacterium kayseriense]MBC5849169.1 hypothetical protein [Flavobacterium kayseriense]
MTRKLNFYLVTTMLFLIITSCTKDTGTDSLIEDKLETMSGKEILRELLIKNDNDVNQLARIFECSPSSLKRIVDGETFATPEAEKQFKNILNQTLVSKDKSLDDLDLNRDAWSYKIKHFFDKYYLWFIGAFVIGVLMFFGGEKDGESGCGCIFGILLICLVTYVIIYFWFDDQTLAVDKFKNTYDPIWEILK